MNAKIPFLALACVIGLSLSARAAPQDAPVDISAEQSLEWYEDQGLYVARGNARATRGTTIVEADTLTAHRRTGASGAIDRIIAEGNVRIVDGVQKISGSRAAYDLERKIFKMTGGNLKYETKNNLVTARDSLEYFEDRGVAVARGRAVATHQGGRIEADVLSATFSSNASGRREMKKMMAQGNVVIVTKDGAVSRGARAVYDTARDVVFLIGDVRITQGETQLAGDRAEVDFKTGQNRLLSASGGRVRALLPSSTKEDKRAAP